MVDCKPLADILLVACTCFLFVVDCKPLADILNGEALLNYVDLLPIFDRVSCMSLNTFIADPIVWHRRVILTKAN